ncbi:hypothetical protein WMF39_34725 [Sorangium sp. So ce1504]|uniref:hypothetical protein n=1 Tax=Sorangium sp. So ce1504 TaxID=3133337 RepID=UPI003F5EB1C4
MGRSASIVVGIPKLGLNVYSVVSSLLAAGWSYDDHGHISYLPVGDRGEFDWQWAELDRWPEVAAVIKSKEGEGELVGVSLVYEDTGSGGEFLLNPSDDSLLFSLTINMRDVQGVSGVVDFTWYLERLIPAILRVGLSIEYLECNQL